ncbi:hypothetical protein [Streptomyces sp. URMC 129]|uniref:hypothetical protein n=1 Tax=Streptomyces sp. URMC 129 TaxID=3423407 RepID=UPI003F1BBA60
MEIAIAGIRTACADCLRPGKEVGEFGRFVPAFGFDARELLRHSVYMRMVGIVESYVDSLFSQLMQGVSANGNEAMRLAAEDLVLQASGGWRQREDLFARYFGIKLKSLAGGRFTSIVDVRNIIAHGQGRVTAKLMEKEGLSLRLQQIDVAIQDARIILGDDGIARCESVCISYISDLDAQACVGRQL